MKNRIITLSFREIKHQLFRFLSLMVMAFLGVFVFVGLKSTAPDMLKSLDEAYDGASVYDLKLSSNLNFSSDDVQKIKETLADAQIDAYVEGTKSCDVEIFDANKKSYVLNVESINDNINKLELKSGSLPQRNNEIVVEENLLSALGLSIGDALSLPSSVLEEDSSEAYNYVISGVVSSNRYINSDSFNYNRGKTNIGNGKINFYSYVPQESFKEYPVDGNIWALANKQSLNSVTNGYTSIYIYLNNAKADLTNSSNYLKKVKQAKELIGQITDGLQEKRQKFVFNEASIILEGLNNLKDFSNEVDSYIKRINDSLALDFSYHIYTRMDYSVYYNYVNDAKSIDNLALVFPIVFYAVAILVSLVSMRRMVNDDRSLIGCLKSQGFSNGQILFKYILFSALATIIGSIMGFLLGMIIIPNLIWSIYTILFSLPSFNVYFDILNIILGVFIAIICIVGVTILTVLIALMEKPAMLLRPKAPVASKKNLLEHIKPLWCHLSFSAKVIIRNIPRYKKRCIVTIIGIIGCSALMLTGFGIRDAIKDVASKQYEEISCYDAVCYLNPSSSKNAEADGIKEASYYESLDINISRYDATLVVVEDKEKDKLFMNYKDAKSGSELALNDSGVILTEKLASLLKANKNDTIRLTTAEGKALDVSITANCEYYLHHYVFISKELYESLGFGYKRTVCYLSIDPNLKDDIKAKLIQDKTALNVMFIDDLIEEAQEMLNSLNQVVYILIILAMMLSFTVLYNLSNINISERKREISTLKVLGFYNDEVDRYITSENLILTIIGIALGLFAGYFLAIKVISTVEIEYVRFVYHIKPQSFIYTAGLALAFTIIVNIIAHFNLKRINMIDSLKSVE